MVSEVNNIGWCLFMIVIGATIFKLILESNKIERLKNFGTLDSKLKKFSGVTFYFFSLILLMFFLVYINDESFEQQLIGDKTICEMAEFVDLIQYGEPEHPEW